MTKQTDPAPDPDEPANDEDTPAPAPEQPPPLRADRRYKGEG
jgi:hypothetical protein